MNNTEDMQPLLDFVYQAMFDTTKKGYSPKEVDAFIEKLKDECQVWNEKYKELQCQLQELKKNPQPVENSGEKEGV